MIALYFPELALKLVEWTEAFAMLVVFTQIDNAAAFWLPADNPDWHAVVVFEPAVNFSHSFRPFAFISANAPTISLAGA